MIFLNQMIFLEEVYLEQVVSQLLMENLVAYFFGGSSAAVIGAVVLLVIYCANLGGGGDDPDPNDPDGKKRLRRAKLEQDLKKIKELERSVEAERVKIENLKKGVGK